MIAKGIVERIYENQTRAGTTYAVQMGGAKYGFFKTKPEFREGDSVEFTYTVSGNYNNAKPNTVKVIGTTSIPPVGTMDIGPGPRATPPARQFYKKDPKEQEVISKQSSLNSALAFMDIAVAAGAVPFNKTDKEKDKFDKLMAFTQQVAADFYEMNTGLPYAKDGVRPTPNDDETFVESVNDAEGAASKDSSGW